MNLKVIVLIALLVTIALFSNSAAAYKTGVDYETLVLDGGSKGGSYYVVNIPNNYEGTHIKVGAGSWCGDSGGQYLGFKLSCKGEEGWRAKSGSAVSFNVRVKPGGKVYIQILDVEKIFPCYDFGGIRVWAKSIKPTATAKVHVKNADDDTLSIKLYIDGKYKGSKTMSPSSDGEYFGTYTVSPGTHTYKITWNDPDTGEVYEKSVSRSGNYYGLFNVGITAAKHEVSLPTSSPTATPTTAPSSTTPTPTTSPTTAPSAPTTGTVEIYVNNECDEELSISLVSCQPYNAVSYIRYALHN